MTNGLTLSVLCILGLIVIVGCIIIGFHFWDKD